MSFEGVGDRVLELMGVKADDEFAKVAKFLVSTSPDAFDATLLIPSLKGLYCIVQTRSPTARLLLCDGSDRPPFLLAVPSQCGCTSAPSG